MMEKIDFKAVADSALSAADNLLVEWLPGGRYDGAEYVALNPTRADRRLGSFRINVRTGSWCDFAVDDSGGDLVALYAYLFSVSQAEAARAVSERLHLGGFAPVKKQAFEGGTTAQAAEKDDWEPIVPVPDFALDSMTFRHRFRDGEPVMRSVYRDADGRVLGAVLRFVRSDGSKLDLPYTFCRRKSDGVQQWRFRGWPDPRPLYGLDALAAMPDAPVLVVEGEKCKNAADAADLGFAVLTWHGGAGNWSKSDWSAVSGRQVILWPDCDSQREKLTRAERDAGVDKDSKPYLPKFGQPGMRAMLGIAERLAAQDCTVWFVHTPDPGVWPGGYDIADALADNGRLIDARQALSWQHRAEYVSDYAAVLAAAEAAGAELPPPPAPAAGGKPRTEERGAEGAEGVPEGCSRVRQNLDTLKRDFALIEGKLRAVNRKNGVEYGKSALVAHFCRESVESWFNWGRAPVMTQFEANKIRRDREALMAGKDEGVRDMMQRYVYLDGSSSIWDNELWRMIDQASAKLAMGSQFKIWLDSPARLVKRFDHVVFEPGREMPEHYINIYRGLPMLDKVKLPRLKEDMPQWWLDVCAMYPGCTAIQRLVAHLCNNDMQVIEFVYNWLAYPLQHPGAKMTTALVFHGEVHGAGKSLLFEHIIKPMYGDYAITLGQSDLESNYTGNRSGKLFVLFEEIFNNKQKYDQTGAMKHMITGKTMRVERKFVDSYEEANHINCVFLSNEAQPFKIEENDRRYFVVWPEKPLPEKLRAQLEEEIGNGGVEQFFMLLLSLPLTINYARQPGADRTEPDKVVRLDMPVRFDPHTKPPMTAAKQNVINYGRYSWQTFYSDWRAGDIEGIPYGAAKTEDVVRLYKWWCRVNNAREMEHHKFKQSIASKMSRARRWWRVPSSNRPDEQRQDFIYLPLDAHPPHGVPMMDFIGPQVLRFGHAVDELLRKGGE